MTLEEATKAAARIEELARSLEEPPAGENAKVDAPATDSGLLSISPRQYREYADEWKSLAGTASNDRSRALYLKMANIWLYAAVEFEAGVRSERPKLRTRPERR